MRKVVSKAFTAGGRFDFFLDSGAGDGWQAHIGCGSLDQGWAP